MEAKKIYVTLKKVEGGLSCWKRLEGEGLRLEMFELDGSSGRCLNMQISNVRWFKWKMV